MKKRERAKRKDNVIFLPGIEQRLTDKGLESLQNKRFKEAIHLLEEAREHDPENGDVLMGLVLAYFEATAFNKAKDLASEMLLKGIGDYIQMVDLYLTILIQLHEYEEIVSTIEVLLDEKEIPPEKHNHFLTILQFSKRMADNSHPEPIEDELLEDDGKQLNLLGMSNLNEQMLVISTLAEKNIRPYIEEISEYLCSEHGHPFIKTMLLSLLKEQEYDKELMVKKFNSTIKVVPIDLPDIQSQPRLREIEKLLEDRVESSDPVLFENIKGMVERILFISYPFTLNPESASAWAGAFHMLVLQYFGNETQIGGISADYQVSEEDIEQAIAKIQELEEISYPNI
ncbi:tetratricopeptide repeat protein [Neobacillus sp. K501]